jgi:hypothetical protein
VTDEVAEGLDDRAPALGGRTELSAFKAAVGGVFLEAVDEVERGRGSRRRLAQVRDLFILAGAGVLDVLRGFLLALTRSGTRRSTFSSVAA